MFDAQIHIGSANLNLNEHAPGRARLSAFNGTDVVAMLKNAMAFVR